MSIKKVEQLRGACNDEDLFARAEVILASGKEGFILETTENRTVSQVVTDETNGECQ